MQFWVYFGTYTNGPAEGIYRSCFNATTGRLGQIELAASIDNPGFLAVMPGHRYLLSIASATREDGGPATAVCALRVNPVNGQLEPVNVQLNSRGGSACHISVDKTGQCVMTADYGGATFSAFPIDPETGVLQPESSSFSIRNTGPYPKRQESPHAHSINPAPGNRFAVGCDFSGDKIRIYRMEAATAHLQKYSKVRVDRGSGPRHFSFHPEGHFGYVINELANTVMAFAFDQKEGTLDHMQTILTLPEAFRGESTTAEVVLSSDGRFLYGSNRGHNSIAIFRVSLDGRLTALGHQETLGDHPRNFALDPTGQFLLVANMKSNNVVVMKRNPKTGFLCPTGQVLPVPSPICVRFIPANR